MTNHGGYQPVDYCYHHPIKDLLATVDIIAGERPFCHDVLPGTRFLLIFPDSRQ